MLRTTFLSTLLACAGVVGVGYYSITQYHGLVTQNYDAQGKIRINLVRSQLDDFFKQQKQKLQDIIQKLRPYEVLGSAITARVNRVSEIADAMDSRNVFIVNDQGPYPDEVKAMLANVDAKRRFLVFTDRTTNSKNTDPRFYYQAMLFDTPGSEAKGWLVVQRPTTDFTHFLNIDGSGYLSLSQDIGTDNVEITRSPRMNSTAKLLLSVPIDTTAWQLNYHSSHKAPTIEQHFKYAMIFVALLVILVLLNFLAHSSTVGNISHDIGVLRQIMRDIKDGCLEQQYGYRLKEFRGAVATFLRLGSEIAEEQGFVSPKGRDHLTRLPNHTALIGALQKLIARAKAEQSVFTVFLMEIDKYQQLLQTYGYTARDAVISKYAQDIRKALRKSDFVSRADEFHFCIVLIGADGSVADRLKQRLLNFVSKKVTLPDGREIAVNWTSGYASCIGEDTTPQQLIQQALLSVQKNRSTHTGDKKPESIPA